MLDAAQEPIDERPKAIYNFILQETLEATDACRVVRPAGDRDLYHAQVCRTQSLLTGDKEQFIIIYLGNAEIPLPDPPISEDPPSLTEVRGGGRFSS